MRITPSLLSLAALLAFAAPAARAGTEIDATKYLPVGAFNAWELIDKALWNGGVDPSVKDESQIIEVAKVAVVDGVTKYSVRTKFFQDVSDIALQLAVDDGVLYLYGVRILNPGQDLGVDDLEVPVIEFDQPVPIGDTTTQLDALFATTAMSATVHVELDLGPKDVDGDLIVEGNISATWNAVESPILTPLGNLGEAGPPLVELVLTFEWTYVSDNSDINEALEGVDTNKSVSALLAQDIGFVEINGEGNAQKIINRIILPGDLVSGEGETDAFPALPPADVESFSFDIPTVVSLDAGVDAIPDGGFTDGIITLNDVVLNHDLGGKLTLSAQATAAGVLEPANLELSGSANMNPKTGGLKISLKGSTSKLKPFAKKVSFSCVEEIAPPFDATELHLTWKAGKDPVTKELITGDIHLPITPFVGTHVDIDVNLPVDVPKVKKGLLTVNPAKRSLGAEGVLLLSGGAIDGAGLSFPIVLKETVTLKEGLPSVRKGSIVQTGKTVKRFRFTAESTLEGVFTLSKFTGLLEKVKIAPPLGEIAVGVQSE